MEFIQNINAARELLGDEFDEMLCHRACQNE
jgi:hypothetical protein